MKLKLLINLNALLIICSLSLNIAQCKLTEEAIRSSTADIYEENDRYVKLNKVEKTNEGNLEDNKILIETSNKQAKNKKTTKTSTKKAPQVIKYKVNKLPNPALKKDAASIKKYTHYKQCAHKTGIINYITKADNIKRTVTVQPSYVYLNNKSISFYQSNDISKTLFATIDLNQISKLTENFPGTFCVTFVKNLESGKEVEPASICGDSSKEIKDWIKEISEFKECKVPIVPADENVIFDFSRVNTLLRERNITATAEAGGVKSSATKDLNELGELFYDNTLRTKSTVQDAKEIHMKQEVGKIIDSITKGNIAEQQIERKMRCKINKAEKIRKEVEHQKAVVRKIMSKREEKERERHDALSKKVSENKEIQLMKAVGLQIKKLKTNALKEKRNQLKNQINTLKGNISTKKSETKSELANNDRLTNYADCVDERQLYKFQNQNYVDNVCKRYFGINQLEDCNTKTSFCSMCCNYHVGSTYLNKRNECINDCRSLINNGTKAKKN